MVRVVLDDRELVVTGEPARFQRALVAYGRHCAAKEEDLAFTTPQAPSLKHSRAKRLLSQPT